MLSLALSLIKYKISSKIHIENHISYASFDLQIEQLILNEKLKAHPVEQQENKSHWNQCKEK